MRKTKFEKNLHHTYVDVHVSHVYTPSEFFVQRNDKRIDLSNLEEKMTVFYDENKTTNLVEKMPLPGSLLACKYEVSGRKNEAHTWLRCLVLKPTKPYKVDVFMIDYGTEQEFVLRDLRILTEEFKALPSQAIKARLSGITPKNGLIWTKGATKYLKDKALETYNLGGIVSRIDGECQTAHGDKASLRLIDTVTNTFTNGIVINEVLVDKDHAVRDTPVWVNDNKNFEITSKISLLPISPYVPLRQPETLEKVKERMAEFQFGT